MRWQPDKIWDGQDVFIIGGGDSLRRFDFSLLLDERVIGCNNAYQYGPIICNICIFGDRKWLKVHEKALGEYVAKGGFVLTNDMHLVNSKIPWLNWMERRAKGLHHEALGWNTNTGASAINLALILGASSVYLLGFDRHLHKGRPNWHDQLIDNPDAQVYKRMNTQDGYMKRDLSVKFPGRCIVNITDNSDLPYWPKVGVAQFFSERRSNGIVTHEVERERGGACNSSTTGVATAQEAALAV